MRRLTLSLAMVVELCAAAPGGAQTAPAGEVPKTARIEGRVLSHGESQPLAGASVRLKREGEGFSAPDPFEAAYVTRTAVDGAFVFAEVAPGAYRVYADQPGYLRAFYGARSLVTPSNGIVLRVLAGQVLKGIDVALPREGSISGRVIREGEPLSGIQITALRALYGGGRRLYVPMESTDTDAEGRFTLRPLRPGRYYVRIDQTPPPRVAGGDNKDQRAAMTEAIRQRYYPDADSVESAVAISIGPSTHVQGIQFEARPRRLVRVRGKVEWAGATVPDGGLVLQLVTASYDMRAAIRPNFASVRENGMFVFEEVIPGRYYLEPARHFIDRSKQRRIGGRVEVEVPEKEEDQPEVVFTAVVAPDIRGSVRIEGAARRTPQWAVAGVAAAPERNRSAGVPPPPPPGQQSSAPESAPAAQPPPPDVAPPATEKPAEAPVAATTSAIEEGPALGDIGIWLRPTDRVSVNAPHVSSDSSGTFELFAVPVGRYQVKLSNYPENTYVKSILFNGQDITGSELDLTLSTGGTLAIVLSWQAGEIGGVVRDSKGNAVSGALVSVWRNVARPQHLPELAQVVTTDPSGAFRVGRLAPGEYKVVAWEQIDPGLAEIPSFCDLFASDAVSVRIEKGDRQTAEPKPVSAERSQQAEWNVPQ